MKKVVVMFWLISNIIFANVVPSYAAEYSNCDSQTIEKDATIQITPNNLDRIVHSYNKTVIIEYSKSNYPDLSNIPMTISYSEYNDTMGALFSGVLSLKSITTSGNSWRCTYSGDISGRI